MNLYFSELQQSSNIILSVQDAQEEDPELLQQQPEDEISLRDLFPDPNDFVPPSPTFTFPPLPPTPPDNEAETETLTESTGRTEIEVSQYKPDLIQFTQKKHKSEKVFQDTKKHSQNECKTKSKQKAEKKKSKLSTSQHQLPVPTVQIMQQGSSEREIMDSIALTKNKLERKEEKHSSRSSSRKSKRKRERKENMRPATAEPAETIRREKEFCEKCYEKKMRRRMEKQERERELVMRQEEEQIVYDPEEPFVDRHIEEAEVLRRYIEPEKVYDDTISMKSYCACSVHAEEHVSPYHVTRDSVSPLRLSQQKLEQVRDAVLVVRNWKHSKEAEK